MTTISGGLIPPEMEALAEGGEAVNSARRGELLRQVLWGGRLPRIGSVLLLFILLFCFVGPHIYHTDQVHANINLITKPPSKQHLLGTDGNGFDALGQLMIAGQSSLEIGLIAAAIATVFGVIYGAVAGYLGGVVDSLMMRIVDTMLAAPSILLLVLLAAIFSTSERIIILILALFAWLVPARLVRGETLTLKVREYVQAARLMGAGNIRIVLRHIIPNALGTIIVNATFAVADSIIALALLSFLGFGPPPPSVNWGGILSDGVEYLSEGAWWLIYPAGIAIVLTVLAFNLLGEGLEEAVGARRRR